MKKKTTARRKFTRIADVFESYIGTEEVPCAQCKETGKIKGQTCPVCKGVGKRTQHVRKPVKNYNDLLNVSQLLKHIFHLPKYTKMIQELNALSKRAASGIVNIVTRDEAEEIIEAIVKSAFPPELGVVYNSKLYGTLPDSNEWSKPSVDFMELLRGGPRYLTRQELRLAIDQAKAIAYAAEKDVAGDPDMAAKQGAGKEAYNRVFNTIMGSFVPNWQQSEGEGGMVMETQDEESVINRYSEIEQFDEAIKHTEKLLDQYEPHGKDVGETDKFDISNVLRRKLINERRLKLHSQQVPYNKPIGSGTVLDGSGFLDFELSNETKRALKELKSLTNPSHHEAFARNLNPPQDTKTVYTRAIARSVNFLKQLAGGSYAHIQAPAKDFLAFLDSHSPEDVLNNTDVVGRLYKKVADAYNSQQTNRVLIVNNVDASGLAKVPQTQRASGGGQPIFDVNLSTFLRKHFCPTHKHGRRAIVMISSEPIRFPGIKAVKYFDFSNYTVDEDEASAILSYYLHGYRKLAEVGQKKAEADTPELAKTTDLRKNDMDKMISIMIGKSVKETLQIVKDAFDKVYDLETGSVDGRKLYSDIVRSSNEILAGSASATAANNQNYALFAKQTEELMGFEDYIRDADKNWGQWINSLVREAGKLRNTSLLEEEMRGRLKEAEKNNDTTAFAELTGQLQRNITKQRGCFDGLHPFVLVYGPGSSGKSSFAECFAKMLDYQFYSANLSLARNQFVGNTEKFTNELLNNILKMSNVVIRMDEIETQFTTNQALSIDPAGASAVGLFLERINDSLPLMEKRNIYIIATCNNPGLVRGQIRGRTTEKEALSIQSEEGYAELLRNAVNFLFKRNPEKMLLNIGEGGDIREVQETAKQLWAQLDHGAIATAFVNNGSEITPRYIHNVWVPSAFTAHVEWFDSSLGRRVFDQGEEEFKKAFPFYCHKDESTGETIYNIPPEFGFEMTTENIVRAAELTKAKSLPGVSGVESYEQDEQTMINGIDELKGVMLRQRQGEEVRKQDPDQQAPEEEQHPEMEDEDIEPVFPPQVTPETVEEAAELSEEVPSEEGEPGARASSTDYFYTYLKKEGVFDKMTSPQEIDKEAQFKKSKDKKKSRRKKKEKELPFSLGLFGKASDPMGVLYDSIPPYYSRYVAMIPCKLTVRKGNRQGI